jgi:hypothetical protein
MWFYWWEFRLSIREGKHSDRCRIFRGKSLGTSCLQSPLSSDPQSKGNQEIVAIPKINSDKSKISQNLDFYIRTLIFIAYFHDLPQNDSFKTENQNRFWWENQKIQSGRLELIMLIHKKRSLHDEQLEDEWWWWL